MIRIGFWALARRNLRNYIGNYLGFILIIGFRENVHAKKSRTGTPKRDIFDYR